MSSLTDYLHQQRALIERELDQLIPPQEGFQKLLLEAARYALLGGGKRIRPILALATVQTLKGDLSLALSPTCALEMVHTYSMIHDDLPCMDDDDYRRGQLTVHKRYSEGHAVLTGDFLLTYAFQVLATDPRLSSDKKVALIATLAEYSGAEGMIGGQAMDLEGCILSLEVLSLLHRKKTAALITAAVDFGAILGDATPLQRAGLREFGESIGLAFQIVDDILDVTCSQIKHGKEIASDILNQKTTYVSLLGIEQAHAEASSLYQRAVAALTSLPETPTLLVELADCMLHRQQ